MHDRTIINDKIKYSNRINISTSVFIETSKFFFLSTSKFRSISKTIYLQLPPYHKLIKLTPLSHRSNHPEFLSTETTRLQSLRKNSLIVRAPIGFFHSLPEFLAKYFRGKRFPLDPSPSSSFSFDPS